jgi:hypothetical protein
MALHAISLLTQRRLIDDIERRHAKLIVLPPPCPLGTQPIDFDHADELIARSLADARKFLDKGGEDGSPGAPHAVVLLLAALIGAYCLNVTTGLPWLADAPEPVEGVGIATKLVEALGLVFALQLIPTRGGRGSLTHKEARP